MELIVMKKTNQNSHTKAFSWKLIFFIAVLMGIGFLVGYVAGFNQAGDFCIYAADKLLDINIKPGAEGYIKSKLGQLVVRELNYENTTLALG